MEVYDFKLLADIEYNGIGQYILNQIMAVTFDNFAAEDFSYSIFVLSSMLGAESSQDIEKMQIHPYAIP